MCEHMCVCVGQKILHCVGVHAHFMHVCVQSGRGGAKEFIRNSKNVIKCRGLQRKRQKCVKSWKEKRNIFVKLQSRSTEDRKTQAPIMTPGDNCGFLADSNTW